MGRLHPPATPMKQLHYEASEKMWVGEISSTNGFGRVWDDSCDEGMALQNLDGPEMVFVVDEVQCDEDGDILFWKLIPILPNRVVPTILLFND